MAVPPLIAVFFFFFFSRYFLEWATSMLSFFPSDRFYLFWLPPGGILCGTFLSGTDVSHSPWTFLLVGMRLLFLRKQVSSGDLFFFPLGFCLNNGLTFFLLAMSFKGAVIIPPCAIRRIGKRKAPTLPSPFAGETGIFPPPTG